VITWKAAFIVTDIICGAVITISLIHGFVLGSALGSALLGVSLGVAARTAQGKARK
jgi:hypothetical protein